MVKISKTVFFVVGVHIHDNALVSGSLGGKSEEVVADGNIDICGAVALVVSAEELMQFLHQALVSASVTAVDGFVGSVYLDYICFVGFKVVYCDLVGCRMSIKLALCSVNADISAAFVEGVYGQGCGYAALKLHINYLMVNYIIVCMVYAQTVIGIAESVHNILVGGIVISVCKAACNNAAAGICLKIYIVLNAVIGTSISHGAITVTATYGSALGGIFFRKMGQRAEGRYFFTGLINYPLYHIKVVA